MKLFWSLLQCRRRRADGERCVKGLFHRDRHFFKRKTKPRPADPGTAS